MDAEQYEVLYTLLTEAVIDNPDDLSLRYARSIAATETDQLAEAEKDLLFVLAKQPKDVNALNALGYTLASKTFRFKEARQYLTQALSIRPNDAAIIDSMGWLNYREGQYEQALVLLEKAYKKTPEGEIAAHLGEALWVLGRQMEAKAVWQHALEKDKSNRYLIEVMNRLK
jgi:Flp pilus assembly protein TadD